MKRALKSCSTGNPAFSHRFRNVLFRRFCNQAQPSGTNATPVRKIWIDLENTPHIPFFRPIIRELEKLDYKVVLTARDAFQTCEMATRYGLNYTRIGRHYGQNRLLKLLGLAVRSLQLVPFVLREKPCLGLNHGARAQILICNLLGIPNVMVMDYEYAIMLPFGKPTWEIVPEALADEGLHCRSKERIRKFAGIKEDVYVPEFRPDASILQKFEVNDNVLVTVRPPATEAHYHNPEGDLLFERVMERICETQGVKAVLLPRNDMQKRKIMADHPNWFTGSKVIIPEEVVDGLNLLWHSDLVVSGGGTMNREAAALGVPVYSIFRGKVGAVDHQLEKEGRLVLVKSLKEVDEKIGLTRRTKDNLLHSNPRKALPQIIGHLEEILRRYSSG